MEGIYDGAARDDCFLCALVDPQRYAEDCPRCGKRMRYQPAQHMDAPSLDDGVRSAVDRYRSADSGEALDALVSLLELLHRFSPQSLDALSRCSVDLGELRTAYQRLAPG